MVERVLTVLDQREPKPLKQRDLLDTVVGSFRRVLSSLSDKNSHHRSINAKFSAEFQKRQVKLTIPSFVTKDAIKGHHQLVYLKITCCLR